MRLRYCNWIRLRSSVLRLLLFISVVLQICDSSLISYNIIAGESDRTSPQLQSSLKSSLNSTYCPTSCVCSHATVICTGQSLRTIPKSIPVNTVRLDLQENKISAIKRTDFVGLKHLKILQIMDNEIQTIEEGSFDSLVSLERIRLNRNRLRFLPQDLFRHNERLHRLDLSENYLTILTDEHLRGPRALHTLQLDRNQLACIDARAFSTRGGDSALEILTLNGNSLSTLSDLPPMPNLRILRLADNPWHCDCRLGWMRRIALQRIASLIGNVKCARPAMLQGRVVSSIDTELKCSGMEKRAAGSCIDASVCPAMCACTETTVDCHDRGLKHIPANLPATTVELRLEQNHITFIPRNAFQNLKKLVRLDLSKNNIQEIAIGAFNGLASLNTLMLYANALVDLSSDAFSGLAELQLLLLNTNRLRCLRADVFAGLRKLNLLSLYDNQIRSIDYRTFADLGALQTLHLARNPLICDCNLKWLATLLTKRAIETSGARCAAPARLARRRLAALSPANFRCKGSEMFVTRHAGDCFIDFECPPQCYCHLATVDCSGRDLTEIPSDIPRFATELLLSRNSIRQITLKANLKRLVNLEKIDLSENQITLIEADAFDGMNSLREINLTANKLRHFTTRQLGSATKSISILILNENELECVTASTFGAMSNLRLLSLIDNRLRSITNGALDNLAHLHSMYLAGNEFACNCHLADFIRYLSSNGTDILFDMPKCAEPEAFKGRELVGLDSEKLQCEGANENVCAENGNYCPVGCVCTDTIVRCSHRNLKTVPFGIPVETTELYLDNNLIEEINAEMFANFTALTKLDLSQNKIAVLKNNTFAGLHRLSTLILSYNGLGCLEPAAFEGLHKLRILSLHANALAVLPERAFAPLMNISHIAIGANSLHCDCAMAWFARWIRARFIEPGIARCESPHSMRNQLLLTANSEQFKCNAPPPLDVLAKCDACARAPCANNATCTRLNAANFLCTCANGFYGTRCEFTIDACYGAPCLNGAACEIIQEGRFRCKCLPGFSGERCETNVDDCATNRCENGATCVDGIDNYECKCLPMFAGKYCEQKLTYCTDSLNPCENGAKCLRNGSEDYSCECTTGFTGRNCTTNVDDCVAHGCLNGARCIDGVASYVCKCARGFRGDLCQLHNEIEDALELHNNNNSNKDYTYYSVAALSRRRDLSSAFQASDSARRSARCSAENCENGFCDFSLAEEVEEGRRDPDRTSSPYQHDVCHCRHGFRGAQCREQSAAGFAASGAFVALLPWKVDANGRRNLTFMLRTLNRTGVLVYYGDVNYVALELFDGRIKASFYVGNYPSSHLYSYAIVADGRPHVVQALIAGREFALAIDGARAQRVLNSGKIDTFETRVAQNLYLGGLPTQIAQNALGAFHLKSAESLHGCIFDVHFNGEFVDFAKVVQSRHISAGCASSVDMCAMVECGRHGRCRINTTLADGFECECAQGYNGKLCEKHSVECVKEKYREHYVQGDCRSVEPIKNARCRGWCGTDFVDLGAESSTVLGLSDASSGISQVPESVKKSSLSLSAGSASQGCCAAVRAKRRRVKMHCRDGGTRVAFVNIVRKCACRNECTPDAAPAIVF